MASRWPTPERRARQQLARSCYDRERSSKFQSWFLVEGKHLDMNAFTQYASVKFGRPLNRSTVQADIQVRGYRSGDQKRRYARRRQITPLGLAAKQRLLTAPAPTLFKHTRALVAVVGQLRTRLEGMEQKFDRLVRELEAL
jgi:hypothetical protein